MQVFYAPEITEGEYILPEIESRHVIRVMRMKRGTAVKLIDGKGNLYEGVIEDPDQKKCIIRIKSAEMDFEKRNYSLHIAISPLKNPERFEFFVEKSVEIGIDEITPVICRNTEKPGIKAERINNIIISAMKQSLKAARPVLNEPVNFKEFISRKYSSKCMIAFCTDSVARKKISSVYSKGEDALIMIGPEGDFSNDEINAAIGNGFAGIHLGTSRLRAETAGIAACHSVYFINQQG